MADLTITATSVVTTSGGKSTANAGETITAGQAVYLKASDGKLYKAQCDGTAAEVDWVGIALNGGAVDQPIFYQTDGTLNIGGTTAKNTSYMVSATAGGIAPQADLTSGHRIAYVGYATATDGSFVIMKKNTLSTV